MLNTYGFLRKLILENFFKINPGKCMLNVRPWFYRLFFLVCQCGKLYFPKRILGQEQAIFLLLQRETFFEASSLYLPSSHAIFKSKFVDAGKWKKLMLTSIGINVKFSLSGRHPHILSHFFCRRRLTIHLARLASLRPRIGFFILFLLPSFFSFFAGNSSCEVLTRRKRGRLSGECQMRSH